MARKIKRKDSFRPVEDVLQGGVKQSGWVLWPILERVRTVTES